MTKSHTLETLPVITMGRPGYATLSFCRGVSFKDDRRQQFRRVITLEWHETLEAAEAAKRCIDQSACGGLCCKLHAIYRVERGQRPKKMFNPYSRCTESILY